MKEETFYIKYKKLKMNLFKFRYLLLLFLLIIPIVFVQAPVTPFLISERTEYGFSQNVVYINITENLGKDQTINVTNDFVYSNLTNNITYKDFKILNNVTVNTYGLINTTLGKWATSNITQTNGTVIIHYWTSAGKKLCVNHTYKSDIICSYVLGDKTCLWEHRDVNGTRTYKDWTNLSGLKQKTIIDGKKIENKVGGIVLPKNSKIQLKLIYSHPIANITNQPNETINKYNITVNSSDGDYSELDPTWWNATWTKKRLITFTNPSNFSYFLLSFQTGMNDNFSDIRFVNYDQDTELNYTIQDKNDGVNATIRLLNGNDYRVYVYYGNVMALTTSNTSNTYFKPTAYYYLDNNSMNDELFTYNLTHEGSRITTYNLTGRIGGARDFDRPTASYLYVNYAGKNLSRMTYCAWVSESVEASTTNFLLGRVSYNPNFYFDIYSSNLLDLNGGSGTYTLGNMIFDRTRIWKHICIGGNETCLFIYVNGTLDILGCGAVEKIVTGEAIDSTFRIGSYGAYFSNSFSGTMDEIGVWDYVLTPQQIYQIYNSSAPAYNLGDEESSEDTENPTVVINSPINRTNTSDNTPTFNLTLTDNVGIAINYTFYLNGTTNMTGNLPNNTATDVTFYTLVDGFYKVIVEATDNASNKANSTEIFLTIDTKNPIASQGTNPIDNYADTDGSVIFDFKCFDNIAVSTIQLWTSTTGTWAVNYTNSSYTNNTWLNITVAGIPDGHNYKWAVWCNDTAGSTNITVNRTFSFSKVNVTLLSPSNASTITTQSQDFKCQSNSILLIQNMTLNIWNLTGDLIISDSSGALTINPSISTDCYQETANVSTACGGLNTGNYTYDENKWLNVTRLWDGDWGLSTQPLETSVYYIVNYTKPLNASSTSIFQFKYTMDTTITQNLTINSSCWNNGYLSFKFNFTEIPPSSQDTVVSVYCYNNTNWVTMYSRFASGYYTMWFFEEAMWWNITSFSVGNLNTTTILPSEGNYSWNCLASNIAGISNQSNVNFTFNFLPTMTYVQSASPSPATAGNDVLITFNVTMPSGITTSDVTLEWNGSFFEPDTTSFNGTVYFYTKKIHLSSTAGNETIKWLWNATLGGGYILNRSTTEESLTVYGVSIGDCEVSGGVIILKMDLYDEETAIGILSVENNKSTMIEVDLNLTSLTNSSYTWNFHKKWNNDSNVSVCVPPYVLSSSTFRIDIVAGFDATDYVHEFWFLDNGTLDTSGYFNPYTSKNVSLYDLLLADSTTFLFTYTDADGLAVDDALIHIYRKYTGNGTYLEVERSKQDNNGQTHVHLVEEDVIYYFMVTQNGTIIYTSGTYNAKCLSTPCSISLSSGGVVADWSIIDYEGSQYSVTSNKTSRTVSMSFNLGASALVNATLYKYDNNEPTLINTSNITASSGTMSMAVPLSAGNTTFFVAIYKNNRFVKSEWVDFGYDARDYFGTFGIILASLIVLALIMMSITEGAGLIVFIIIGLIVVTIMTLAQLSWMALISLICAGAIIIWKMVRRRRA